MRGMVAIVVFGLAVGGWMSGATAEPMSSKLSGSDAKSKSVLERAGTNSIRTVESKVRAAGLRHDADPSVDLSSLKTADPQLNSKFNATSKVSAKTGTALAATQAAGGGENAKTSSAVVSKAFMGAVRAIDRTERHPDAVNARIKVP